ncbi:hypothetical protein BH09MYX1_BH09MYX1_04120 [soil metagenome]
MPHRDDGEAARARAEALAQELEQVKAEHEALKRENDALKDPKAAANKPLPPPDDAPNQRDRDSTPPKPSIFLSAEEKRAANVRKLLLGASALGVLGVAAFMYHSNHQAVLVRQAYDKAVADRKALVERWRPLSSFEPCVREVELAEVATRTRAPTAWTEEEAYSFRAPDAKCVDAAQKLAEDGSVDAAARNALWSWIAVEKDLTEQSKTLNDYLLNRDFKEDALRSAPARLKAVLDVLDREHGAVLVVVRDVFPALRTLIRGYQGREDVAHGHSSAWWSVELGLEHWEIGEIAMRASGLRQGKPLDLPAIVDAIAAPVAAWTKHAADAPVDVRRIVRQSDGWTGVAIKDESPRSDLAWEVVRMGDNPMARMNAPGLAPEPVPPLRDDD